MIDILLTASITGGIIIVLWYLTYPLSKKMFKSSWHYMILKITMLFMLLPISIFAPMINDVFAGLFVKPNINIPNNYISEQIQKISIDTKTIDSVNEIFTHIVFPDTKYTEPSQTLIQPETEIEPIKKSVPPIPYLQIIWVSIAVLLFLNGIRKMHKFTKHILNNSDSDVDFETKELFTRCKEELKLKGTITLRISDCIKTPLVFGLIKPFIIFPATNMNIDEKRLALTHELTHIKNGDLWIKRFASIITSIHWFNPLAYFLSYKISVISEEYCDECVVKTMTKEERLSYGYLILKTVSDVGIPYSKFYSALSAPTKNLKRRLYNMINIKKSSKRKIFLSIIAAFILFSMAATYAFAANVNEPAASYLPTSSKSDTKNDIEIDIPEDFIYFNREINISDILEKLNERLEKYNLNFDYEDIVALMENRVYISINKEELEKLKSEIEKIRKILELEETKSKTERELIKNNSELVKEIEKAKLEIEKIRKTLELESINFYNLKSFTADTFEILYEMVEEYFDTLIEAGNITQEEADEKLIAVVEYRKIYDECYSRMNEILIERSFTPISYKYNLTIDNEGNIINWYIT